MARPLSCGSVRVSAHQEGFVRVSSRKSSSGEVRTCKALSDLVMCLTGDGSLYRLPSGYGADEPRLVP